MRGNSFLVGLYDHLIVEYALDAPVTDAEWQTKTIAPPYGNHFKIDAGGRLWRFQVTDLPASGGVPFKVPRETIVVPYQPRSEEWVSMDAYSGIFTFYEKFPHRDTELWWEYEAVFEGGKMTSIKRIKPRVIPE